MDLHHEHFFVVASVEDADVSPLGQPAVHTPQVVVTDVVVGGPLERMDLTTCRIDARHHRLDRSIFAGGVERLKHDQERPAPAGEQPRLQLAHLEHRRGERIFVVAPLAVAARGSGGSATDPETSVEGNEIRTVDVREAIRHVPRRYHALRWGEPLRLAAAQAGDDLELGFGDRLD